MVLAKEFVGCYSPLPGYVSLFSSTEGRRRPATGFLGGEYAPLLLENLLRPANIDLPAGLTHSQHDRREELRSLLSPRFSEQRAGADLVEGYNAAYAKVRGLMQADQLFDLDREPAAVRVNTGGPSSAKRPCWPAGSWKRACRW